MFGIVIVVVFSSVFAGDFPTFDPTKLILVDSNRKGNAFFFRGNYPGNGVGFSYDLLRQGILDFSTKFDLNISIDFYLSDISLLQGHGSEDELVEAEEGFFQSHPETGQFIHWELHGYKWNITTLKPYLRESMLAIFGTLDLGHLHVNVPNLKTWIMKDYGPTSQVFFLHGVDGVDRTGEFVGSYIMETQPTTMNFQTAYALQNSVKGELIESNYAYMMNFYCYFMQTKFHNLDCSNWF